jgi:hypothetical protein
MRIVAAQLLTQVMTKEENAKVVALALEVDDDDVLHLISRLVRPICGEESRGLLTRRLSRPLSRGCVHLFDELMSDVEIEQVEQLLPLIFRGLEDDDPTIAAGIAAPLPKFASAFKSHTARLRTLAEHWKQRGSWCDRHSRRVTGTSCPECNIVPPNPRSSLTQLLSELDALTNDELAELTLDEHHDVAEVANAALAEKAKDDAKLFRHVLCEVIAGRAPRKLGEACLKNASQESLMLAIHLLLECSDESLRLLAANSLNQLSSNDARPIAMELLRDPVPACRTQAVRWLRAAS